MQNSECEKIPKVIHYCWFGGKQLPKSARRCIESWKKFLPDYEIRRWDESNYDYKANPYTRDAYADKRYAYVSDMARLEILEREGGVYFDTDVELIANPQPLIDRGSFLGCEYNPKSPNDPIAIRVAPGLGMAASPNHPVIKRLLNLYHGLKYENPDGKSKPFTIVDGTTSVLESMGLRNINDIQVVEGMTVYPEEYLCPISIVDMKMRLTDKTVSIHFFDQSWQSPSRKFGRKVILALGGVKLKKLIKKLLYRQ